MKKAFSFSAPLSLTNFGGYNTLHPPIFMGKKIYIHLPIPNVSGHVPLGEEDSENLTADMKGVE